MSQYTWYDWFGPATANSFKWPWTEKREGDVVEVAFRDHSFIVLSKSEWDELVKAHGHTVALEVLYGRAKKTEHVGRDMYAEGANLRRGRVAW